MARPRGQGTGDEDPQRRNAHGEAMRPMTIAHCNIHSSSSDVLTTRRFVAFREKCSFAGRTSCPRASGSAPASPWIRRPFPSRNRRQKRSPRFLVVHGKIQNRFGASHQSFPSANDSLDAATFHRRWGCPKTRDAPFGKTVRHSAAPSSRLTSRLG